MALLMNRKVGESILIGEDIEIFVTEISGKKVKLSVRTDKKIPIYRKEIRERMIAEAKEFGIKPKIYIRRKAQESV